MGRRAVRLTLVLAGVATIASAGQPPAWWTTPETAIWESAPPASGGMEHDAAFNVGQLKHVATMAHLHLEQTLGPIDWHAAYGPYPNPFPFGPSDEHFAVVNVGQLKAVAVGFYRVLASRGYPSRHSLLFQGADPAFISKGPGFTVPWGSGVGVENYAPANLGQLKLVFSFAVAADGSSAFDLSGIEDDYATGTDDLDGDLWSSELEDFMGLETGFNPLGVVLAREVDPEFAQDLQDDINDQPGMGTGPVLMVPYKGFFRVLRPELSLRPL